MLNWAGQGGPTLACGTSGTLLYEYPSALTWSSLSWVSSLSIRIVVLLSWGEVLVTTTWL
jgi:hypothetical protein